MKKRDGEQRAELAKRLAGRAVVVLRHYYSISHMYGAAWLAHEARKIEKDWASGKKCEDDGSTPQSRHRGMVTGAIIASAAFMEAQINEFFVDAAENNTTHFQGLDSAVFRSMGLLWKTKDIDRLRLMSRYDAALALAGKEGMKDGGQVWQNADLLRKLRNELVHARPASWTVGSDKTRLERRLRGAGFAANPLMESEGNPFFPDHCLGFGCAKWALESALAWTGEFFKRIGTSIPYAAQRDEVRKLLG